jgi:hypothetical protein
MTTLAWILVSSIAMSAIALVGVISVVLSQDQLQRLLLPLVAFSAGSLLGGALLHLCRKRWRQAGLPSERSCRLSLVLHSSS